MIASPGPPGRVDLRAPGLQTCLGLMLRGFERTIGFAEGVVMSFDPDVLLPTAFATTVDRGPEYALLACRNEQLDVDFLKFRDLARAKSHVGVACRERDARVGSSPRWAQILDAQGHRHELRAALVDGSGRCWGALNLLRGAGSPFLERDLRHVEDGIERNASAIARSMMTGAPPADCSLDAGSLWLDGQGAIVFASPTAERWLGILGAQAPAGFGLALLAGLAIRAGRDGDSCLDSDPAVAGVGGAAAIAVRARTADGRWVRVRAERISRPGETPAGVAVVIDSARAGVILPLTAAAYRLTERELEVTRGVLNGLDTKSIAGLLRITEYTVQDHLKAVFEKAGVRSRRELAHQLAIQFG